MAHDVHIVGSVPLADATEVFSTLAGILGPALKRIPDGETGERLSWVGWLGRVFATVPQLELTGETWRVHEAASGHRLYRLKPGARVDDICFDNLPYGDFALQSYAVFKRLRDAGKIPAGTKFQVDFAPAHSAARSHVVDSLLPEMEPIFNEAIMREIDRISAAIPHRISLSNSMPPRRSSTSCKPASSAATARPRTKPPRISPSCWQRSAIACRRISICSIISATATITTAIRSSRSIWAI